MEKTIMIAWASWFGNCEKLAENLEEKCRAQGLNPRRVALLKGEAPPEGWDALVLVTPVRMGNVAGPSRKFAKAAARRGGGKPFALVISHGAPLEHFFSPVKPSRKLAAKLVKRGMKELREPLFCMVAEQEGPLKEGWEEKLEALAMELAKELAGGLAGGLAEEPGR